MISRLFVLFTTLYLCSATFAQDDSEVSLGATITGNQEQPKVLYIVPWKQTKDNTILNQSLESRLSDVFDHVDRDEHLRELEYFDELSSDEN
jgi:hypothetical protein